MAGTVQIEAARDVDRDRLLAVLEERGLSPRAVETDGVPALELPCDGDAARVCDELLVEVESWIAEAGLPLVPVRTDGAIFVRPPGD